MSRVDVKVIIVCFSISHGRALTGGLEVFV